MKLPKSNFFWSLPHNIRRLIYWIKNPFLYKYFHNLKKGTSKTNYSLKEALKKQVIFIHIPKAAGISINKALFGNFGGGHLSFRHYQLIFSKKQFDKFYKFTIVRNPYDRLLSAYYFLKKGGMNEKDKIFAKNHIDNYKNFEDFILNWLNEDNIYKDIHFYPQAYFICDSKRNIAVNHWGYYENIEEEIKMISTQLNLNIKLKKFNKTDHKKIGYRKYYNTEMRRIVERVYKTDFSLFSYRY